MLLTTGGKIIYLSTPFGKVGEFYRCWINEDGAYNSFTRFSASSEEVIRNRKITGAWTEEIRDRALEKLERDKKRMSARQYAEEYEGKFIDGLMQWFPEEILKQCCILKRPEHRNPEGRFYLGVDIARMGADDITYEILEMNSKRKLLHRQSIVLKKKYLNETYDKIIELDKIWKFRYIYVDSGGIGVGVADFLLASPIKHKVIEINNRSRSITADDKHRVKLLKEDLYNNMLGLLERKELLLLDDDEVYQSLKGIRYEYLVEENRPTKLRIFGEDGRDHIAEGLIRACWSNHDRRLNMFAI